MNQHPATHAYCPECGAVVQAKVHDRTTMTRKNPNLMAGNVICKNGHVICTLYHEINPSQTA